MFNTLKSAFKSVLGALLPRFNEENIPAPTARDMQLDVDEWQLKRRLGKNFFRKRLNPRYRAKRIAELTPVQRALARERGWIA